jgi:hypothetical protein
MKGVVGWLTVGDQKVLQKTRHVGGGLFWGKNLAPRSPKVPFPNHGLTRGVSHYGLAIYIKKYLKAEEELWKLKYFTIRKYNLTKIL